MFMGREVTYILVDILVLCYSMQSTPPTPPLSGQTKKRRYWKTAVKGVITRIPPVKSCLRLLLVTAHKSSSKTEESSILNPIPRPGNQQHKISLYNAAICL